MTHKESTPSKSTGESRDARAANLSSLNQSVQLELAQTSASNLAACMAVSLVSGALLVAISSGANYDPASSLWFASLCACTLALWLYAAKSKQQHRAAPAYLLICTLFWSLAAHLPLAHSRLDSTLLITAIILMLPAIWPGLYLQPRGLRRLFLVSLYLSAAIGLPQISPWVAALLLLTCAAIDCAAAIHRRTFIATTMDALKNKDQVQQTLSNSRKITSLIDQTPLGYIEWNQNREIIGWNPAATAIFGFAKSEALGQTTDFLFEDKKTFLMEQAEHDLFLFGKDFSGTTENITSDGTVIICEWNETPLFDDKMNVIGAASFVEDVTDRVRMQTRIKQQAYFDPLTGLPNRHRLMEELNRVISLAQRTQNFCALLFIDLDHFKEINDSRGHHYGDLALTLFAQRLRKVIRTQETVARLGGDEFVVLLERLGTEGETARLQIAQVAEKILDAASEQFIIKGEKFQISCSIGIVFFNDGSSDSNSILEQADQALYTIKREGKSNFYFHNRELSLEMQKQMELLERLRDESRAESFLPYYQPILDTQSNLINGLQVFLRWQKPSGDIVEAHEFIQVLESGSIIVDISLSLINQTCKQVNLWRSQGLWQEQQRIFFTLSLRELEHPSFILQLQEAVLKHGVSPRLFIFGLHTEILPKINSSLKLQLELLRELGCGLMVDNVGFQSLPLQKLRELQIDTIRISHRLMAESLEIESAWNLVRGLVELCKSVGLDCIAPCIEEAKTHHQLIDLNCQYLQGNLIAPPSPPTSITRMLIERNSAPAAEVSSN